MTIASEARPGSSRVPTILAALGVGTGIAVVVALSDIAQGRTDLRTQAVSGVALTLAGIAFALALVARAGRETDPVRRTTYRWLAVGTVGLFCAQGLAYVVLAAGGAPVTRLPSELAMLLSFPAFVWAMHSMPPPLVTSPHESQLITADGVIAFLCFAAVLLQEGVDDSVGVGVAILYLVMHSAALAAIVWVFARNRHPGLQPARQLALWMTAMTLYVVADVVAGQVVVAWGITAVVTGSLVFVLVAGIGVLASSRRADEVETEADARWRSSAARIAPLVPPLLVVVVILVDLVFQVRIDPTAGFVAMCALAAVVTLMLLLRQATERELDRAVAQAATVDLSVGTGQPWFRALVSESRDIVTLVDLSGDIVYQTPSAAKVLGYAPGTWIGRPFRDLVMPGQVPELAAAIGATAKNPAQSRTVELSLSSSQGGWRQTETTITSVSGDDGPISGFVLTTRDVTDRRHLRDMLEQQAETDALTGRANLAALRRQVMEALRLSERGQVAIVAFDLDGFSAINDSLGHAVGDQVIHLAGNALVKCVRPWDLVARIGGDEFAIVVVGQNVERSVTRIQERARRALAGLVLNDGHVVHLTASAGYAVNDNGSESSDDLMRNADLALARARSSQRVEMLRFEHHMHEALLARVQAEQELRAAFKAKEFELHFQPVVALATGRIIGAESLVRWRHPYRGLVTAGDFISLVEDLGLGPDLGVWVVGKTAEAAAAVRARFPDDTHFQIGFNVSAGELEPRLVDVVDRALAATGAPADSLIVEITESAIAEDSALASSVLNSLRERGLRVAIDDFGTGYSSLASLAHFPVDYLKIDRSFIVGMSESPQGHALVAAVVSLALALGLAPVAEGVETQAQADDVEALGCRGAQGWLFAPALPLDELLEALEADREGTAATAG